MIKLIVDKIDGYNYYLKDERETYILNIEFYGVEDVKNIEYIYMHESLLKEKQFLSFGPLNEQYGRKITSSKDEDLMVLITKDKKEYCLKRFYG